MNNNHNLPPVITIDGPSGVGKGTIAHLLSKKLEWYLLDSGSLYRGVAWAAIRSRIDIKDEAAINKLLSTIQLETFSTLGKDQTRVICDNQDITDAIRTEEISQISSKLSAIPQVRSRLLNLQRAMRQWPGLVADGRDMGTVVFADAPVKFFFQGSVEERAKRRYLQLKEKGINVSLREIQEELVIRDHRDQCREIAPTIPASDAVLIDTTHLNIQQVLDRVMEELKKVLTLT